VDRSQRQRADLGGHVGRAASRNAKKAVEEQRKQLDRTLAEQRDQLDRTLNEQRTRTLNERFATAARPL
jgi:dsDNA-binding SOS-regulon protein